MIIDVTLPLAALIIVLIAYAMNMWFYRDWDFAKRDRARIRAVLRKIASPFRG